MPEDIFLSQSVCVYVCTYMYVYVLTIRHGTRAKVSVPSEGVFYQIIRVFIASIASLDDSVCVTGVSHHHRRQTQHEAKGSVMLEVAVDEII
jgi:hypothetical protein